MKLLFENWRQYLNGTADEEAWELITQPDKNIKKLVHGLGLNKIPGAGTDFNNFVKSEAGSNLIAIIDKLAAKSLAANQLSKLKNFNNKKGEETLINKAVEAQQSDNLRQAYVELMTARDSLEGRERSPERLGGLFDNVVNGSYEPPVLLNINNELYVIGGRTRLYAGLIAQQPMKVKLINVNDLEGIIANENSEIEGN